MEELSTYKGEKEFITLLDDITSLDMGDLELEKRVTKFSDKESFYKNYIEYITTKKISNLEEQIGVIFNLQSRKYWQDEMVFKQAIAASKKESRNGNCSAKD